MLFVFQHDHISRVSFLVCLSVFACTPVHSNSPTTSTDSLACFAGALTKQLSDSFVSQNMYNVPVWVLTPSTRVFRSGSRAGLHPWTIQLSQLRICKHGALPLSAELAQVLEQGLTQEETHGSMQRPRRGKGRPKAHSAPASRSAQSSRGRPTKGGRGPSRATSEGRRPG